MKTIEGTSVGVSVLIMVGDMGHPHQMRKFNTTLADV